MAQTISSFRIVRLHGDQVVVVHDFPAGLAAGVEARVTLWRPAGAVPAAGIPHADRLSGCHAAAVTQCSSASSLRASSSFAPAAVPARR